MSLESLTNVWISRMWMHRREQGLKPVCSSSCVQPLQITQLPSVAGCLRLKNTQERKQPRLGPRRLNDGSARGWGQLGGARGSSQGCETQPAGHRPRAFRIFEASKATFLREWSFSHPAMRAFGFRSMSRTGLLLHPVSRRLLFSNLFVAITHFKHFYQRAIDCQYFPWLVKQERDCNTRDSIPEQRIK